MMQEGYKNAKMKNDFKTIRFFLQLKLESGKPKHRK